VGTRRPRRRTDVASIGDAGIGIAALQRKERRRHSPPRHGQLAALRLIADDRSRIVRKDSGKRRQVARPVRVPPQRGAHFLSPTQLIASASRDGYVESYLIVCIVISVRSENDSQCPFPSASKVMPSSPRRACSQMPQVSCGLTQVRGRSTLFRTRARCGRRRGSWAPLSRAAAAFVFASPINLDPATPLNRRRPFE